jgi:ribonuclease P protein component
MAVPVTGRIRSQQTFAALRRPAGRGRSGVVRAAFVPPTAGDRATFPLVAYTIGKRCGTAVRRNRIRRRLRAAVAVAAPDLAAGSYVLGADPTAGAVPFVELVDAASHAMREAARRGSEGRP